jgi:hypothetical protein
MKLPEIKGIKWWIRLLLWFKPYIISVDNATDEPAYIIAKRLFGVTYVIQQGRLK